MNKFKLTNKKAKYDYFLDNHLEVGLVLKGTEIKSILDGSISLKESYVKIINNEMWLLNASLNNDTRPIKLLLHKKQINKYNKLIQNNSNSTLILYEIYVDINGRLKGTLCFATGKKQYDKRQTIKERDLKRQNYE